MQKKWQSFNKPTVGFDHIFIISESAILDDLPLLWPWAMLGPIPSPTSSIGDGSNERRISSKCVPKIHLSSICSPLARNFGPRRSCWNPKLCHSSDPLRSSKSRRRQLHGAQESLKWRWILEGRKVSDELSTRALKQIFLAEMSSLVGYFLGLKNAREDTDWIFLWINRLSLSIIVLSTMMDDVDLER